MFVVLPPYCSLQVACRSFWLWIYLLYESCHEGEHRCWVVLVHTSILIIPVPTSDSLFVRTPDNASSIIHRTCCCCLLFANPEELESGPKRKNSEPRRVPVACGMDYIGIWFSVSSSGLRNPQLGIQLHWTPISIGWLSASGRCWDVYMVAGTCWSFLYRSSNMVWYPTAAWKLELAWSVWLLWKDGTCTSSMPPPYTSFGLDEKQTYRWLDHCWKLNWADGPASRKNN